MKLYKLITTFFILTNISLIAFANENKNLEKSNKNINAELEKTFHLELGLNGFGLQIKGSSDITPYYELGGKIAYGILASANNYYLGGNGAELSLENKFYFSKRRIVNEDKFRDITEGSFIKAFAGFTFDGSPKNNTNAPKNFPVIGTGIGYSYVNSGFGVLLSCDLGSSIEISNEKIAGVLFLRPELNFKFSL
ncbi:MAG: hypothetical protein U0457_07955 [Candidatus Sericytochromatia bacterium]